MKPLNLLSSAALLAFLALSCAEKETETKIPTKSDEIPVSVISLEKTEFSAPIAASGTFSTKNETLLSFKMGGIVSDLKVEEGQKVSKGQLIASLDMTEISAGLTKARLGLEKAERDYARAERLYRDSVATLEQFQNASTALEIAKQETRAVEFNAQYAQIRANQNGFILKKFVNEGQQVSPGTPIFQVNGTNSGTWYLKATVNDTNWGRINLGDSVAVSSDTDDTKYMAQIVSKSQSADPMTGAYWVEIEIKESSKSNLASGMFGRATIYPSNASTAWQVPYASVLDAQGNKGYVFVTKDGKTAQKIEVSLGQINASSVQVLSGLEGYTRLIVSGSAYLTDQSNIIIQN